MFKNKHTILKYTTILTGIVVVFLLLQFNISNAEDVDFYVSSKIPSNQVDKTKTYFDLLMKPGDKQKLEITVYNEKDKDITVKVDANTAVTNYNGVIDYHVENVEDENLKNSFSEIADVENKEVVIPAKGSKNVSVNVTMPEEEYDGVILGGIVVTRKEETEDNKEKESEKKSEITINNEYSYVVGVKLSTTKNTVEPKFELAKIEPKLVDYRGAIVHYIQNAEATIVKDLKVDLNIINTKTNEKYVTLEKTIEMAPNSTIELPVFPESNQLEPGDYKSEVKLTLDDKEWEYDKEFKVESADAKAVNKEIPKDKEGIPVYIWIIISTLVVVIITLVVVLYKKRSKTSTTK